MQQELTDLGASSAHDKQAAAPQTNENALTLGGEVPARIDGQLPAPVNCKDCACHCEPEGRSTCRYAGVPMCRHADLPPYRCADI